jgi:hypothetical protein
MTNYLAGASLLQPKWEVINSLGKRKFRNREDAMAPSFEQYGRIGFAKGQ